MLKEVTHNKIDILLISEAQHIPSEVRQHIPSESV